jgi:hypothetical protein
VLRRPDHSIDQTNSGSYPLLSHHGQLFSPQRFRFFELLPDQVPVDPAQDIPGHISWAARFVQENLATEFVASSQRPSLEVPPIPFWSDPRPRPDLQLPSRRSFAPGLTSSTITHSLSDSWHEYAHTGPHRRRVTAPSYAALLSAGLPPQTPPHPIQPGHNPTTSPRPATDPWPALRPRSDPGGSRGGGRCTYEAALAARADAGSPPW